jgi:hypothetical protein
LRILRFATLTFLITLSTGILVVLSERAQLVNGARPIQHPLPLPMPLAITLIVLGGWAPGLAAIAVTAWDEGRPGVRELLSQFKRWRVRPIWVGRRAARTSDARLDRSGSGCADGWDNTS